MKRAVRKSRGMAAAVLAASLMLVACGQEEQAAPPEPVRAIKYMTLQVGAAAQQRRISGVIVAGATSDVAFQTAGQVMELTKAIGDRVTEDELLARLDPEPLRLRLASAESELQQARASLADAESKYRQQKQLFEKGYATRTAYESALATAQTARGALGVAESQVRIARRDLEKSALKAPFDGVVARQGIERFEEVTPGQLIYTLQTENEYELEVAMPETLIGEVTLGQPVSVLAPLATPDVLPGKVSEIAPLAEGVNAYPVTIRLSENPPGLRPGMSAQAIFEFRQQTTDDLFTVPISAISPETGGQGGQVFVFNDGKVSARDVQVVNIRDNLMQIRGDIEAGEIVAVAGASLLYDGMPARLLDPAALR